MVRPRLFQKHPRKQPILGGNYDRNIHPQRSSGSFTKNDGQTQAQGIDGRQQLLAPMRRKRPNNNYYRRPPTFERHDHYYNMDEIMHWKK